MRGSGLAIFSSAEMTSTSNASAMGTRVCSVSRKPSQALLIRPVFNAGRVPRMKFMSSSSRKSSSKNLSRNSSSVRAWRGRSRSRSSCCQKATSLISPRWARWDRSVEKTPSSIVCGGSPRRCSSARRAAIGAGTHQHAAKIGNKCSYHLTPRPYNMICRRAAICAGVVPQHPPMMAAPCCTHWRA